MKATQKTEDLRLRGKSNDLIFIIIFHIVFSLSGFLLRGHLIEIT